jgi:hypothetical protein
VTAWPEPHWTAVTVEALGSAPTLCEAAAWLGQEGTAYECWKVEWGSGDPLLILFVPSLRRAGVVWGNSRAEWTDCEDGEEAVRRYLAGRTDDRGPSR